MMKILIKTQVSNNFDEVFKGFDLKLFKALKPPLMSLDVERFDGCKKGDEVHLKVGMGPIKNNWVSLITEHASDSSQHYFIDEGKVLPFPISKWKHIHRVIKIDSDKTEIHDDISFTTGFVPLDILIYPAMYLQFLMRRPVYKKVFNR